MVQGGAFLTADAVYNMRRSVERELMGGYILRKWGFMQGMFQVISHHGASRTGVGEITASSVQFRYPKWNDVRTIAQIMIP